MHRNIDAVVTVRVVAKIVYTMQEVIIFSWTVQLLNVLEYIDPCDSFQPYTKNSFGIQILRRVNPPPIPRWTKLHFSATYA